MFQIADSKRRVSAEFTTATARRHRSALHPITLTRSIDRSIAMPDAYSPSAAPIRRLRSQAKVMRRAALIAVVAAGTALIGLPRAQAQSSSAYPDRPVRLVIPFTPGGGTDVIGRMLAHALRGPLGQPIVVENKPGAAGAVGSQLVVQAAPDGYTLLFAPVGSLTITPNLPGTKASFDPLNDLTPVGLVARQPVLLVASAKLGVADMKTMLALAAQRRLTYGTPGTGTELHLIGETFRQATRTELTHVPYRGGGPAITDLIAGNIDLMVVVTSSILPHIRSGAVKPLVTTDTKRLDSLPEVPTTAEVGLAQVDGTASWGVLAPKGLPAAVLDKLQQALQAAARDAEFAGRVREAGAIVVPLGATEFSQYLRRESDSWRKVIVAGGLRAD
ncbi:MAG: tripartite tricarboxylate transporter substrate binding protein [Betaproteobacteria bacterium]|nr:tripartite tricarboxylate transporter substrate binding protein [Betaproteobacteria bacterium]